MKSFNYKYKRSHLATQIVSLFYSEIEMLLHLGERSILIEANGFMDKQ